MPIADFVLGEKFVVDGPTSSARGPGRIVELSGGRFVIGYDTTWSAGGPIGTSAGQILSATGLDFGSDFRFSAFNFDQQSLAAMRALPGGGFIAVWDGITEGSQVTAAQRFDDNGAAVGEATVLRVLPPGSSWYQTADLVPLSNGNFLLVSNGGPTGASITGQICGPDGSFEGVPIDLDGGAAGASHAHIDQRANGGFVVSWVGAGASNDTDCSARLFGADGTPQGAAFTVNTATAGDQRAADVAFFADGSFVAVWTSSLGGRQDVYGQLFTASGAKVGAGFLVNVSDNTFNDYPAVAVLADQSFVVTWQRPSFFINAQGFVVDRGYGITAQAFAADGTKTGGQFWIDDSNGNRYSGPSIEALNNGGYAVTWYDQKFNVADPETSGLKARIFGPNSPPSLTSPDHAAIPENTVAVMSLLGTDLDVNARLTYAISGGFDASLFRVNAQTGALSFAYAPDFEATAFHPNTYTVQVSVSDGHATAYQTLTINVTDVREAVNLTGTPDADTLTGTEFSDSLAGLGGNDVLIGNEQDDYLDGGTGTDLLYGGAGSDTYVVDGGDLVFEGAGEGDLDRVFADSSFYLFANVEYLFLNEAAGDGFGVGNELDNTIFGNSGHNLLIGLGGGDFISGGDGNDALFGMDGADTLYGDGGIDYLAGGAGNDTIDGGSEADALYGEGGDDVIWAGAGFVTDILTGGAGNDELHADSGEADYDLIDGGSGNDTYWVDTGDDLTFEAVDGGIDTVIANVPGENNGVYLYANVENLILEGTTKFGVGNELTNHLTGSYAANWLLGGAGNDTIEGGAGDDVLFGEAGADRFVFAPGSGADLIGDFAPGVDTIDVAAYGYDWAGLQAAMGQVGGDTFINLLNGDLLVLSGVSMNQLQESSFIV
ncbi:cadherin domain-containing protein [Novosphingobium aquiterrae]|uniref:Cadherin domain-containing protein n=1 Tax=Novosphingobium aquiterrae TaxID=624388 RepID=A0ABV6PH18_9SPHN